MEENERISMRVVKETIVSAWERGISTEEISRILNLDIISVLEIINERLREEKASANN